MRNGNLAKPIGVSILDSRECRRARTLPFLILGFPFFISHFFGCSGRRVAPAYEPHETLLTILAEFERHANLDLYRFPAPLDPSGMNVFRVTLTRLANYEHVYPDRFKDVVAYARGQVHERLGDFDEAAEAFESVLKMDTPLAADAAEAAAINRRFDALLAPARKTRTLGEYLDALAAQRSGLDALAKEYETVSQRKIYKALARRQTERADVERAETLWKDRNLLKDGTTQALDAWKKILEDHAESARIERHRLRLGDCYYEMAREYAQQSDPDGGDFDLAAFERMAGAAMGVYRAVERAYGYPERLQARGKIDSLNAFIDSVRARAR